jgi:spermidine/putrescine ABC transporter ATP-binding subunit
MRGPNVLTGLHGATVRVEQLVKDFGKIRAVDGVTIESEEGEFLALLGPSGSGKTSILMSLAGFETPTAGEIFIGDACVTDLPPNRRNIGIVFQSYALFPHMTVRGNIEFPLRARGMPKDKMADAVAAAIEMVRLQGQEDKLPSQMSGGQQQRVAIARAIVFRPQILLMDEPLGALDRRLREDMQFEIKQLQRQLGITIIYVTHDQEEALVMADRVAVLRAGKLEQIGTPEELYDQPANAFVADFIGQTNLIPGKVIMVLAEHCRIAVAGGQTLDIRNPGDVTIGDNVQIGLRPERIQLQPADKSGLQGIVREAFYAGGTRIILVEIAPGLTVKARLVSGRTARCAPGDAVTLRWDADYVRLFPLPSS